MQHHDHTNVSEGYELFLEKFQGKFITLVHICGICRRVYIDFSLDTMTKLSYDIHIITTFFESEHHTRGGGVSLSLYSDGCFDVRVFDNSYF